MPMQHLGSPVDLLTPPMDDTAADGSQTPSGDLSDCPHCRGSGWAIELDGQLMTAEEWYALKDRPKHRSVRRCTHPELPDGFRVSEVVSALRGTLGATLWEKWKHATFASYAPRSESQSQALARCEYYAETWREQRRNRRGLIMHGTEGAGKTHLLIATARAILEQDPELRVSYLEAPGLVELYRERYSSDANRYAFGVAETLLKHSRLLLLDEIGHERTTSNATLLSEIWFAIVDARADRLPMIGTSNLHPEEWAIENGGRMDNFTVSRLRGHYHLVDVVGPDHRRAALSEGGGGDG